MGSFCLSAIWVSFCVGSVCLIRFSDLGLLHLCLPLFLSLSQHSPKRYFKKTEMQHALIFLSLTRTLLLFFWNIFLSLSVWSFSSLSPREREWRWRRVWEKKKSGQTCDLSCEFWGCETKEKKERDFFFYSNIRRKNPPFLPLFQPPYCPLWW